MRNLAGLFLAAVCALPATNADARPTRSHAAKHAFVKTHACPATGLYRLPCPGYHIDHITPLCAGGPDDPSNMQWITREEHKAKTRADVSACRMRS